MQSAMILRDLALFFIPVNSRTYTSAWEFSLPLVLLSQGYAGIACYRAIAGLYPRIGSFAIKLFAAALALTALLCLAGLPVELRNWHTDPIFRSLIVCYRWIDTLLAGGLVLATAFLARFPAPLKKLPANLFRHTALLAGYFAVYAITAFLPIERFSQTYPIRSTLVCLLYAAWTVALTKRGEECEVWLGIDSETATWVDRRNAQAELLYQQAAGEMLSLQVSRTK
jgi:hypothetical protein